MNRRRLVPARASCVVVAAVLLQVTLVSDLRIAGAMGDVVLVVVVAAGLTGGADRGVAYGFAAGLLYDLLVASPFGLTALTYAVVGYLVGVAATARGQSGGWWAVGAAAVVAVLQAALFTALGNLVGVDYPFGDLPAVCLSVAALAAVLVLPVERALWWAHGRADADRLEVLLR